MQNTLLSRPSKPRLNIFRSSHRSANTPLMSQIAVFDGTTAPTQKHYKEGYKEREKRPWDIGKPQQGVVRAFERGLFRGEVLDIGSGLGDNAIYLAKKGLSVTGVDFSPEALEEARKRLSEASSPATDKLTFLEGDAFSLDTILGDKAFDTALDCSLMHCFSPGDQKRYISSLSPHVKPGGKLLLFAFSDQNEAPWHGPSKVSKELLSSLFNASSSWKIISIESSELFSLVHGKGQPGGTGWAYFMIAEHLYALVQNMEG